MTPEEQVQQLPHLIRALKALHRSLRAQASAINRLARSNEAMVNALTDQASEQDIVLAEHEEQLPGSLDG